MVDYRSVATVWRGKYSRPPPNPMLPCQPRSSVLFPRYGGCMPPPSNDIHPGLEFGVLTIVSRTPDKKWMCRCVCGRMREYTRRAIKFKKRERCCCLRSEGRNPRSMPEYTVYRCMIERCYSTSNKKYPRYGGRGITVCERWRLSFAAFLDDMGPRPKGRYSVGRKNNDGNYEPTNCRWETDEQQQRNTSHNRLVEYGGKLVPVVVASELSGIKTRTIRGRLSRGWSSQTAAQLPLRS